ncbi:Mobile element protein [Candidatus Enterovibrio altilux]|uniref:Mobile element protein n=1 Tax=Candidatus Enterovibrio altilux TaxID=1927128 RepID=A0A291BAA0_9GAMM|nr:Mobile element protein [Candidatus Enterovibrio luxaltus]
MNSFATRQLTGSSIIKRGSLTFWIDEEAIQLWNYTKPGKHGRPRLLSD